MFKVSVVMPVYNTEKYVWEAISSILSQTFSDYEFIIIDDCSSDNTYNICKEYSEKDSRVKVYKNKYNIWVVKTRNELFKKVDNSSKYIAIMDADDISNPDRLLKQYQFLEKNKDISVLWWSIEIIDYNSEVIWYRKYPNNFKKVSSSILKKSPFAQPSVMIRKIDLLKVWYYNIDFERCQDYELWFRFFDLWYKLTNIDDYLIKYRVFEWQWKSKHLKLTLKNTIKIQSKYIYKKKYFNINSFIYHNLLKIITIFPNSVILKLFKILEYKNAK